VKRLPEVDTVIAGGGWTGLLLARRLAERKTGAIVALERGGPRRTSDYLDDMDELDFAILNRMSQPLREETVTIRHGPRDRALPMRQYGSFLIGAGAGGAGEQWSGISFRFLPEAFDLRSRIERRYGAKRLPEDSAIQDWGVTYRDLEPYYWRVERMLGLSGKAGNLRGRRIDGGNVFEGPRQFEYPTPPMKTPYLAAMFRDAAKSLGWHPYPLPAATTSQPYTNPDGVARAGCAYCGYCERFGCMIGAKAQPTNVLLPVLRRRRNFELRTNAWVRRIVVEGGRARGVIYVDAAGEECFQPAAAVVLASWTLNNTRLMLLSKVGQAYDPATGTGTMGRNLTHQVSIPAAMAFFEKPLNRYMGAGAAGVAVSDFDGDVWDHKDVPFLGGGFLYTVCYGFRPMANFGVLPPSVKDRWGSAWKKASIDWYDRTGRISFYGEHMAYRGNYMDLDPTYTDKFGDPLLRLTIDWRDNERRMVEFIVPKAVAVARAMGAREWTPFAGLGRYEANRYQGTHIQGGTIMGTSPETSVVDTTGRCWGVPNLYVAGASTFPQNPAGNPTLTALALAWRTAEQIA
jgi:gluconate 2-dehydrogenase alpha chain